MPPRVPSAGTDCPAHLGGQSSHHSLSAPLLPLLALLHFLTALATARIKSTRYSFTWLLLAEALWLATFACVHPWVLGCLLALSTFPPYLELVRWGGPTRVYILHMAVFLGLLFAGLLLGGVAEPGTVSALLMLAVLVRTGTFPTHVWVTDLFENCFFGTALLDRHADRGGVRGDSSRRPIGADWVLQSRQRGLSLDGGLRGGDGWSFKRTPRFFAFLFLGHFLSRAIRPGVCIPRSV